MAPAMQRPWRILVDDGERDPRRNLALEEALGRAAGSVPTVRLWRNGRSVVVGRSQVVEAEVDLEACRALAVPVVRRFTGGGTVYHDPGNLNVSVVLRPDDPTLASRPSLAQVPGLYRLVLEPLAAAVTSLGLPARATQREVLVDGAKVSGVAAWVGGQSILVHATLLVDADLALLDRLLRGPGAPGNPRWERTRSRPSAVTSLARALDACGGATNPDNLGAAAEAALLAAITGGAGRSGRVTRAETAAAGRLMRDRYERPAWHMGTS